MQIQGDVYWAVLLERTVMQEAFDSLLDVAAYCATRGFIRITLPYTRTDAARNRITRAFITCGNNPHNTLVMLDNDHIYPVDVVERLAQRPEAEGVIGALAFRRGPPYDPCWFVREGEYLRRPAQWDCGAVYECDAVGTGAIAIKRWVFDRLTEAGFHWPYFRYEYPEGLNFNPTEDMYFARICEEAGIRHHVDTALEIPHITTKLITQETWEREYQRRMELQKLEVGEEPAIQEA